jgi:nucleoside 2-deoxyribosyltransferase
MSARCILCGLAATSQPWGGTLFRVICPRCGSYAVLHPDAPVIEGRLQPEHRPMFSEWVYQQNRLNGSNRPPLIKPSEIPAIASRHKLTFSERVDRLLAYLLEKSSGQPGSNVDVHDYQVHAALQTFEDAYVSHIVHYLHQEQILNFHASSPAKARSSFNVQLTPKGIMRAEELVRARTASAQGFVAMWFTEATSEAWDKGFRKAIEAAGYAALRIDKAEHVNKICDEIISEIRKSRFVVADFTGQRGGVYFEAGYALRRDIPVIWTCSKDNLPNLHFDIRQYNCIDWVTPDELSQRLKARIEALLGEGPQMRPQ